MNQAKLAKLQKMKGQVRTGGKGSVRRRKKVRRKNAGNDQKKLQMTLKRLGCNYIPNIDEVNLIKDDGHVIQFKNPNGTFFVFFFGVFYLVFLVFCCKFSFFAFFFLKRKFGMICRFVYIQLCYGSDTIFTNKITQLHS
eukprot:TRINITY_DN1865_c0_g1_i1.p1 TRINITY_DN1865_c0_g1~~TRINITY_DN1865_c0_g1_i1.p1  ORF type:complete len:139 (+),score=8.26 TRINITY_DN1865_c0_g1_i1:62-478(+)